MSDLQTTLRNIGGAPPAPFDVATATRTARVRAIRRRVGRAFLVVALLAISLPLVRNFGARESGVVGRVNRNEQGPAHESKKEKRQGTTQSGPRGLGSVGSRTQPQQAPAGVAPHLSSITALRLSGRLAFTWDMDTGGQTSGQPGAGNCAGNYWCSPVSVPPPSSDLKVMDLRTGRISPVTTSPAIELESRFSPNGSVLAYSVEGDGVQSLDTIRPDGSDHHRLVAIPGKLAAEPTWSPDGKRIAFVLETASSNAGAGQTVQGNESEIWVVNADGTDLHKLDAIQPADHPRSPAWAPDGKRIAYTSWQGSENAIRVTDLVSSRTKTLTGGAEPAWSPDGKSLAADDGRGGIKIVDLLSGAERTLVDPYPPNWSIKPAWSPDGRWLAFARVGNGSGPRGQKGTNRSIWIVRSSGKDEQKVIDGPDDYVAPTWGPAK